MGLHDSAWVRACCATGTKQMWYADWLKGARGACFTDLGYVPGSWHSDSNGMRSFLPFCTDEIKPCVSGTSSPLSGGWLLRDCECATAHRVVNVFSQDHTDFGVRCVCACVCVLNDLSVVHINREMQTGLIGSNHADRCFCDDIQAVQPTNERKRCAVLDHIFAPQLPLC